MSYLTKDQLENYLSKLPGTNKGYNELKNDLTYPVEQDDLGSVKDRMNKLRLSTGTQIQSTDVRTPAFPQTPKPTRSPKVSVGSPAYAGQACAGCNQQVRGSVVSALGGLWHTRCFTCHKCHKELENEQYYEKDGLIYCAKDYRLLFSVYCHACGEPIEHQALRVLGKHYHEDHFCCCVCKTPIGGQQFKVHEDQPYCLEDYMKKFGKKCSKCGDFLQGEYVNALGQAWHKNCFHCTDCERTFQGGSFLVKDNKPYCEEHYPTASSYEKPSTSSSPQPPAPSVKPLLKPSAKPALPPKPANKKKKCHVCQSIIDGPCATALGHDFHIHHFQCHRCHRSLSSRVPGMWQGDEQGELVCKMCMK